MKPFSKAIGDVKLAQKIFGDKQEVTWLKDGEWEYTRMTLTRDGRMDWKDEDLYDHDTTSFTGTYTLKGTQNGFTVIGRGESIAKYDAFKDTASYHHDTDVIKKFESSRFTGKGFVVTKK